MVFYPPTRLKSGSAYHMARSINQSITDVIQLLFKLEHHTWINKYVRLKYLTEYGIFRGKCRNSLEVYIT